MGIFSISATPGTAFTRWGFDSWADYTRNLKASYGQLKSRAFSPHHVVESREDEPLPRTLNWFHVSALGVGLILGAGARPVSALAFVLQCVPQLHMFVLIRWSACQGPARLLDCQPSRGTACPLAGIFVSTGEAAANIAG